MKTKHYLFALMLLPATASPQSQQGGTNAAPVGKAQALAQAQTFAARHGWSGITATPTPSRTAGSNRAPSRGEDCPPTYIFNDTGGKGFVVISGIDAIQPVIAYCDNTTFDAADAPRNLLGWLENIEEEITMLQGGRAFAPSGEETSEAIEPLVTSGWDQGAPYNAKCPNRYFTGCVATAMAQVMHYHRWPEQTAKTIPAYTTRTAKIKLDQLPVTTFDWDGMNDHYTADSQDDAVATLMRYAGQSVKMDYTANESGAQDKDIPNALKNYFNYSPAAAIALRANYSIDEWDKLLIGELKARRPIIYCGISTGGGHAFVCDGYDAGGLYHINWGWSNRYDGYYRISLLNPGITGTAGASSTADGYASAQSAITGVRPPQEGDIAAPATMTLGSLGAADGQLSFSLKNASGTIDMGFAIVGRDGSISVAAWQAVEAVSLSKTATCTIPLAQVADKLTAPQAAEEASSTILAPVFRTREDEPFARLTATQYYIEACITNQGDTILTPHPMPKLKARDIRLEKESEAGRTVRADFTLANEGDEYNGQLYLFTTNSPTASPGKHLANTTVAAAAGQSQQLSLWFTTSRLDGLTILIATDTKCSDIIGRHTVGSGDATAILPTLSEPAPQSGKDTYRAAPHLIIYNGKKYLCP